MSGRDRLPRSRRQSARPARLDARRSVLTELWRVVEIYWFGAPERGEAEVREDLDRLDDLERDTRLSFEGDRLVRAVVRGRHDSSSSSGPASSGHHDGALAWVTRRPSARMEVLERDAELLAALTARRWRHPHSAFELFRPVSDG